jgi:hypothetical protein
MAERTQDGSFSLCKSFKINESMGEIAVAQRCA